MLIVSADTCFYNIAFLFCIYQLRHYCLLLLSDGLKNRFCWTWEVGNSMQGVSLIIPHTEFDV